ncbi:MAG: tetratricopeptide repeat protein, partial [Spirochaetales bacterium]|nr:tetratricopeptide repeat protein [Spirochaetales bacterium]
MSDIINNNEENNLEPKSPEELEQIKISELSRRGYQLLKEKMISEAEDCFNQILELDNDNNYALVGLGDAARKKGKFKDAIIYYQRCLDLYEMNNYALFGLADCYKALRKFNQ